MTHVISIVQCTAHSIDKYPMGMFYYVCDCGVHSQCWPTRKLTKEMAELHARP